MSGENTNDDRGRLHRLRVLSDGRPGHENQSVGLALALARRTGARHDVVKLDPTSSLFARLRAATVPSLEDGGGGFAPVAAVQSKPQLIISAGHRTHLPLWWAARRFGARSVVIMRPSLPLACFDLALVPRHDVGIGATDTARRVLTRGALNRVPEDPAKKASAGLVLIGGPSKHHGWDAAKLAPMLGRVISARPDLKWTVADSRRTPDGFLAGIDLPGPVVRVPHQTTGPGWLAAELARAEEVWVTEDSVSMLHEAVTAGAATGLLPMPPLRESGGRTARAATALAAVGLVVRFPDRPAAPTLRFHEAGRCAEVILARWF